jgi:hypothetical protein
MNKGCVNSTRRFGSSLIALVLYAGTASAQASDPLLSWNDGIAKKAITDFVAKVTKVGGPDYVPIPERIAVFDNDGTLWSEQPIYVQMVFAFDRVKALAQSERTDPKSMPHPRTSLVRLALLTCLATLLCSGAH